MTIRPPRAFAPRIADNAFDVLQHEIVQEQASTLGRLTQDFERTLAAFTAFEARSNGADDPADSQERERLLNAAGEALWIFVVQREACGLRNTEAVLREYKVPQALRLRMGVTARR